MSAELTQAGADHPTNGRLNRTLERSWSDLSQRAQKLGAGRSFPDAPELSQRIPGADRPGGAGVIPLGVLSSTAPNFRVGIGLASL